MDASRPPEFRPGATAPELDEEALGDALLRLVVEANGAGVDPDRALRLATARLADRATAGERMEE